MSNSTLTPNANNPGWAQAAGSAKEAAANVGEMACHAASAVGGMASRAACDVGKQADELTAIGPEAEAVGFGPLPQRRPRRDLFLHGCDFGWQPPQGHSPPGGPGEQLTARACLGHLSRNL